VYIICFYFVRLHRYFDVKAMLSSPGFFFFLIVVVHNPNNKRNNRIRSFISKNPRCSGLTGLGTRSATLDGRQGSVIGEPSRDTLSTGLREYIILLLLLLLLLNTVYVGRGPA